MDPLFSLSDAIVTKLKKQFSDLKETIGVYAFEETLIRSSSFKIIFSNQSEKIILSLNLHPLEMPWSIEVLILNGNETVRLNSLVKPKEKQEVVYEVNHGLLNDPNGLGNELAKEIAEDLLNYLIKAV
ncbi:MAG TPA: hypothetical protein PK772_06680 [Chitinophagaceae bacterium]|nr:hypothetical protein [Chitinophagaceae bacterium]